MPSSLRESILGSMDPGGSGYGGLLGDSPIAAGEGFGAGRFLSAPHQQFSPTFSPSIGAGGGAIPGVAYQPNYRAFYDPMSMLQAGPPSFIDPMWYTGVG